MPIGQIEPKAEKRVPTRLAELDRVLGGGLVPGSGMLIAGEPGIGKSTLLLQTAQRISAQGARFLYVTGEESAAQVRLRSDRIGKAGDELYLLAECDLERIEDQIAAVRPAVVGIDSIQTVRWAEVPSSAGGVTQVREVTARLLALARREGFPLLLVGHVTKDGGVAGPRVLEHMVDGVLQFEGERGQPLRILRGIKNRFGSTQEVGIFEMRGDGLAEISNPSKLLLGERRSDAPGSATAAILEGSRPLLVEVQALVSPASHGTAARKVSGLDASRLSMLAAVFEKRLGLPFGERDIHANVVGGVKMSSTAGDLALITGQKPEIRKARKSIAQFKLREGMPIGARVTLRGDRMWEFLDRLVSVALPRIRDFRGLSPKQFDGTGNYTFGLNEQSMFHEINIDDIDRPRGMDITVVTSATNDDEGRALLRALGFPFKEN